MADGFAKCPSLAGRVAFVTGDATGIGAAFNLDHRDLSLILVSQLRGAAQPIPVY